MAEEKLTIEEILAKEPTDVSDKEKSFLEDHREEMTEEQMAYCAEKFGIVKEPAEPPVEPTEPPTEPPKPPEPDYKKKFRESSREALLLREQVKKLEARVGKVEEVDLPTDEEMGKIYSDWEMLSDFEKNLAKRQHALEKKVSQVHSVVLEGRNEKEWTEKLDKFLALEEIMEQFPGLADKKEEFKKFAMKPTHKGIPLEVLAKSFLFDTTAPQTPPTPSESILETGSGGGVPQPPSAELTPEQIKTIRETDSKKYRELVKSGKISKAIAK